MKVGIQLYSVRNMMQKDAKITMKTVADLGYKYICLLYTSDRRRAVLRLGRHLSENGDQAAA